MVLEGIASRGVTLPNLGVFVTTEGQGLDYRPGADWGPATLEAFFDILAELAALDLNATMSLEEGVLPDVAERHQKAWRRFEDQR